MASAALPSRTGRPSISGRHRQAMAARRRPRLDRWCRRQDAQRAISAGRARDGQGQAAAHSRCVVGGFRYLNGKRQVGSLLLGLYNDKGQLDHVGFTSTIANEDRAALTAKLEALRGGLGFTGKAPGGLSRWSTERSGEWEPVKPELVVEVRFDHVPGDASGMARRYYAGGQGAAAVHVRADRVARGGQSGHGHGIPAAHVLNAKRFASASPLPAMDAQTISEAICENVIPFPP